MFEQYFQNQFLRAFIILVFALVIMRISLTLVYIILNRLSKRTKSDADDILIEKSKNPMTLLLFFISIRIGLEQLSMESWLSTIIERINHTLILVSVAYVLYLVLDIIIFRAINKFVKKTKTTIDDGILTIIQNSLKVALIVIAILYILHIWGIQIGPFLAGLGIAGLAVALALQPTLSNIFSGIALILDKTVRVGDLVYLDADTRGTIEKIGFRSTKIKTADNELVIIPNSKLADSKIQNIALPEPKSRVTINFTVAYGSNIDKIKKIVLKEINSIKKVSIKPEPTVQFIEMADSALKFKTFFFVNHYDDRSAAMDEANTKIYNALNKNKIEVPFPQLDVHIKKK